MSFPPNPLEKYKSSSYYHCVVLCDNTDTAEELAVSQSDSVWQFAPPSTDSLGGMAVQTSAAGGKYCVLINGSRSATFVVETVNYTTALISNAVANDRGNSFAVEGKLIINEPRGIIFLDRVVQCCQSLSVDIASAVWVLKTFFVGHTDSGAIDHISDVHPFMFATTLTTGSFSERGGTYELEIFGVAHGLARLPQYSSANFSIPFVSGGTLKDAVINMNTAIQEQYDKHFLCVKKTLEQYPNATETVAALRPVKYTIQLDEEYQKPSYVVNDQQPQLMPDGTLCGGSTQHSVPANSSLESSLYDLFTMCKQAQLDATPKNKGDIRYQPKVTSLIRTSKGDSNATTTEIIYKVKRMEMAGSLSSTELAKIEKQRISKDTIHLDYTYTGKNIDILEFDMKMAGGVAYIQSATASTTYNTSVSPAMTTTTVSNWDGQHYANKLGPDTPKNIPVYFGMQIKSPGVKSAINPDRHTQAAYNLSKYSSLEVSEVSMQIVGNPDMLGSIAQALLPSTILSDGEIQSEKVFSGWGTSPLYAEVTIKMPRNNDDYSLFNGLSTSTDNTDGNDYAVDFWYNGRYSIWTIEHVFQNGNFTQTLHMGALPKSLEISQALPTESQAFPFVTPEECGTPDVPCNKSPSPIVSPTGIPGSLADIDPNTKLPVPQPGIAGTTKTTEDFIAAQQSTTAVISGTNFKPPSEFFLPPLKAKQVNDQIIASGELNKVKGWAQSTPEVKQAIVQAAMKHNINVLSFVKITSVESLHNAPGGGFNPESTARNNKKTKSTADGLYQIVDKTWADINNRSGYPPIPRSQRFNPADNAEMAARLSAMNFREVRSDPKYNNEASMYGFHNVGVGGYTLLSSGKPLNDQGRLLISQNPGIAGANATGPEYVAGLHSFVNKHYHGNGSAAPTGERINDKNVITNGMMYGSTLDCTAQQEVKDDPIKTGCTDVANNEQPTEQGPATPVAPSNSPATPPASSTTTTPINTATNNTTNPTPVPYDPNRADKGSYNYYLKHKK